MRRSLLLVILLSLVATSGYSQFSASLTGTPPVTTGWNIGGSASVVGGGIQLTPPAATQSGYVYYNTPVNLTACGQFTVDFDFRIVVTAASQVADGIAFWYISNPPTGFSVGGGIGLPANPNGLIMIMDTYDNTAPTNVPLATLLGYNGSIAGYVEGDPAGVLTPVLPNQFFMTDGAWHHCKITYNLGTVNVYFNGSATVALTGNYPLSIAGYFGFSSSTGAAYSTQSIKDVFITAVGTSTPPTVVSPVTYCVGDAAVPLTATASPGGTVKWFTTDTATVVPLAGAPTPSTSTPGTTTYYVRQGSGSCISSPDSIKVIVSPHPTAPLVSGINAYCQGVPFVPFSVSGATGSLRWYSAPTGGIGSPVATTVPTAMPGVYDVWVSQVVAGCEGPRDSISVHVTTTPPVPSVTGTMQYCQYIGPFVPLSVGLVPTGSALWYPAATGGTGSNTAPALNINIAGNYTSYVSQVDSGCESARLPVTVAVHPKPAPPAVAHVNVCQYLPLTPLTAGGTSLTWYGPGVTAAYTLAPTPLTNIAKTDSFFVTQTSAFGCISDSALIAVKVIPQPAPPATADVSYCRLEPAAPLTATGLGLKWYSSITSTVVLLPVPVPPTGMVGTNTWYVSQTVNGCESVRAPMNVTTLYLPSFTIEQDRPFVCQHDSMTLSYSSADTNGVTYAWVLPHDALAVNGTGTTGSSVTVQFNYPDVGAEVRLFATDRIGRCKWDTSIRIKVVELPTAKLYARSNVCIDEEMPLALIAHTASAHQFTWRVDDTLINNSTAVHIVTASSNTGGPYTISWNRPGPHIIQINAYSIEGCTSAPTFDTVLVHTLPDATFKVDTKGVTPCTEDSILFVANTQAQDKLYQWSPSELFVNLGQPVIWGKPGQSNSKISLRVTDPFGCTAESSQAIKTNSCCTVAFPSAFTPNGEGRNNIFRPVMAGYHRFHTFRIANRWGQTVFESANSNPGWDGTYNGVAQDIGVYYYFVRYDCDGSVKEQKGDVTLIR